MYIDFATFFEEMLNKFPEFSRKGRFDELFWVALPGPEAREDIFRIYLEPHFDTGYFTVRAEDIQRLGPMYGIPNPPQEKDVFKGFCRFLARDEISTKLTGAEIEHSIKEALFKAYDNRDLATGEAQLTPDIVVPITEEDYQAGRDPQVEQAIAYLKDNP